MRRVLMVVALLSGTLMATVPAGPASADAPDRRVAISVRAHMLDTEGWPDGDVSCYRHARYSTVMSADDGEEDDFYPWYSVDNGSFIGDPLYYFFCGNEVSVCLDLLADGYPYVRSSASVGADSMLWVEMHLTWYEADGLHVPCNQYDWFAKERLWFYVQPGKHSCQSVTRTNSDGDGATLEICASNLDPTTAYLLEAPPPTVSHLQCEGATRSYSCNTNVNAPGGLSKISWFVNNQEVSALQNLTNVTRSCAANSTVQVRVTVTDRQSRTASRSASVRCSGTPL